MRSSFIENKPIRPLSDTSKKDILAYLKWAKEEVKEWGQFVQLLEGEVKRRK